MFSNFDTQTSTFYFWYRKIEVYSMLWADRVDLNKYIVTAGSYGGPIGNWIDILCSTASFPMRVMIYGNEITIKKNRTSILISNLINYKHSS